MSESAVRRHSESHMETPPAVLTVCLSASALAARFWRQLDIPQIALRHIYSVAEAGTYSPALILLDSTLLEYATEQEWRNAFPSAILMSSDESIETCDLLFSDGFPEVQSQKILQSACEAWLARKRLADSQQALAAIEGNLDQLASVGIALSAENDLATLLRKILT